MAWEQSLVQKHCHRSDVFFGVPPHSFLEVFRKIGNGKVGNGTESQKKIGNMDKKVGNRLGMGDKRSGMKRSGMGMNLRKRSGMPAIPDLFSRE